MQINESKEVFANYTVSDYRYGRCHLFALALNEVLEKDIALIINENPFYEDCDYSDEYPPALEHAYCVESSEFGLDAGGLSFSDDLYDEYCVDHDSTIVLTGTDSLNLVKSWMKLGLLLKFEKGEKSAIKSFIKNNFRLDDIEEGKKDERFI